MRGILTAALLSLLVALPAFALQPDPATPEAFAPPSVVRAETGARWVDAQSGVVRAAFDLAAGPFPGSPAEAARAYLSSAAAELGIKSDRAGDLELVREQETPLGHHVWFRQLAGGYPVFESDVVVTLAGSTGRVIAVASRYAPAADAISAAPVLTEAAAREAAIQAIGATPERIGPETAPALGLLAVPGRGFPLAYRVVIPAANPIGDWEVMVDAVSGAILRVRDQALSVDGTGLAFDPDPLTTAQAVYGTGGFVDNNDANSPDLQSQTFQRPLPDITFLGGLWRLTGPYCNIQDFESPAGLPVAGATPSDFQFTRDNQGFEEALVYWGIDMSERYIQSLGFNNIQNNSIWCDPHGFNGADNSHYIPSTNRLAWGEGGVDDAEDLDVVLHEYGHAIQNGSVPGWGGGDEGSMGEGFGDYWAGSYSASVSLYRWEWVFNWDGHNPFWPGRILNSTGTYPANWVGGVHDRGQLWSSTLMQIWFEITRPVTDQLVLQHHFLLGTTALVTQAAAALVTADRNLPANNGLNVDTIVDYCVQRGFMTPGQFELPVITHTPLGDTPLAGPYPVVATCTSASGIASVEVRYGTNGQTTGTAPMLPTGNPDEYAGAIPDLGTGVSVNYFIVAENNATPIHNKRTHPRPAPFGGQHVFQVSGSTGIAGPAAVPGRFVLAGNAPNPFHPQTTLTYSLATPGPAELKIYDARGQLVRVLVRGTEAPIVHHVVWDGRDDRGLDLPSGVYLARLTAGGRTAEQKLVLMK
jgi:zinc metalloprotease ZmpB